MSITFDGNLLEGFFQSNAFELRITSTTERHAPGRILQDLDIVRQDGSKLVSVQDTKKEVAFTGLIIATSSANLIAGRDYLMSILYKTGGVLDMGYGRQYTATLSKTPIISYDPGHSKSAPFELAFMCHNPYSYDINYVSSGAWSGITTDHIASITCYGTKEPLPRITYTFQTAGTLTALEFRNTTTSQRIKYDNTNPFNNNDIVIIDCELQKILLNGNEVAYQGIFPSFVIGANQLYTAFISDAIYLDLAATVPQALKAVTTYGSNWEAQSFVPTQSGTRVKTDIMLFKDGNPPNSLILEWRDNVSSLPGSTVLATATLNAAEVATSWNSMAWHTFKPLVPANLTAGTTYWLVLYTVGGDFYNCYRIARSWKRDVQSSGQYKHSSDSGTTWWTTVSGMPTDLIYKDYVYKGAGGFNVNYEIIYRKRWR